MPLCSEKIIENVIVNWSCRLSKSTIHRRVFLRSFIILGGGRRSKTAFILLWTPFTLFSISLQLIINFQFFELFNIYFCILLPSLKYLLFLFLILFFLILYLFENFCLIVYQRFPLQTILLIKFSLMLSPLLINLLQFLLLFKLLLLLFIFLLHSFLRKLSHI